MQDRHRYRAWDTVENRYIYNAEMVYDTRGVVAECFGYMLDGTYGDRYIVEQCTGLKDKNDKLIYEGDIVALVRYDGSMGSKSVVKYGEFNCSCCDGVYGWYFDYGDIRDVEDYEVIGNIHENPELLEEYKKNTQS